MFSLNLLKFKRFNIKTYHSLLIQSSLNSTGIQPVTNPEWYYYFSNDFPKELKSTFYNHFIIHPKFINVSEEESLLEEIEPLMKRMRYQYDHWDNAIEGFREIERAHWRKSNSLIFERVKKVAFASTPCLTHAHVLDLDEKGHIKPHIDSVRFCGNSIAGLNLLSDAIMRLQKDKSFYCDVFLKRRSLYVMSGAVRFDYTHEILPNGKSQFKGSEIIKKRRISVILRSEPDD